MRALPFSFLLISTQATYAGEICAPGQDRYIHIGAQTFAVSVADSSLKRQRGLSGLRELSTQTGMWFEFERPEVHGFWMQAMNFPIDLIWISSGYQVLGAITLQPCTDTCPIYLSPGAVRHVLEVNAGEFAGKVGDRVTWSCSAQRRK